MEIIFGKIEAIRLSRLPLKFNGCFTQVLSIPMLIASDILAYLFLLAAFVLLFRIF